MNFSAFFLCHIIVTVLSYLLVRRISGDKIQAFTEAGIVFCVPVIGFFIVLATRISMKMSFLQTKITPHLLMSRSNVFTNLISYDENAIPLHDAFLVEDTQLKRKVFLDAVKQNVLDNPQVLQMATHDSDREIAYYAVSMVSGHIEELESHLAELELAMKSDSSVELLQEYAQLLDDYLGQSFVDPLTKQDKRKIYQQVLRRLSESEADIFDYLWELVNQDILLENYTEAVDDCERMQEAYPDREEPYLLFMKLYFVLKQPEQLQAKRQELLASGARLSPEAMEQVRYWGGGYRNGL